MDADFVEDLVGYLPIILPAVFIVFWTVILFVLSNLGGWHSLAQAYPAYDPFSGETRTFQSFQLNRGLPINYSGVGIFGADFLGVHMSVFILFRFGHPPLRIPYSDLSGTEVKSILFNQVVLQTALHPGIKINVSKKLATWLEERSGGSWQFTHLVAAELEQPS